MYNKLVLLLVVFSCEYLVTSQILKSLNVQDELSNSNKVICGPINWPPVVGFSVKSTNSAIYVKWESSSCTDVYCLWLDGKLEFVYNVTRRFTANPCTEYTVKVGLSTIRGCVSITEQLTTTTELRPTAVRELAVTLTNMELFINWKEPSTAVQCVKYYIVTLSNDYGITRRIEVPTKFVYMYINNLVPCMTYTVSVQPYVRDKISGPPSSKSVSVNKKIMEAPKPKNPVVGTTFAILEWIVDSCLINACEILKVIGACVSKSPPSAFNFLPPFSNGCIDGQRNPISMNVTNLMPYTNYTCRLSISNSAGDSDYISTEVTFETSEDIPTKPQIVKIQGITTNSFLITWEKPALIPGIQSYTEITIISYGPQHDVPRGCFVELSRNFTNLVVPIATKFSFTSAFPNYRYEVYVRASTSPGFGPASDVVSTTTKPTAPEAVRNPKALVIINEGEMYSVNALISFVPSCNTNGNPDPYQLRWIGERFGYFDDSGTITINDLMYSLPLKAEYHYEVTIVVRNTEFGTETKLYLDAPSGVPRFVNQSLEAPIVIDDSTASLNLTQYIFDEINGDILFYALILAELGFEESSTYGHWDGTAESWPYIGNWTNNGDYVQPYQVTPMFWNPPQGIENFTLLGTDVCSTDVEYCNGPLRELTTYAFKVRSFTNKGYRDSATVYFKTLGIPIYTNTANLGMILGIIFGIIGAATLLIFICILCCKRRKYNQKTHNSY